jgi:ribosomal protein L3 glutamine methyltransferase
MKIGDLIALGEARFTKAGIGYGQGTLNAWDESRWLTLIALDYSVDSPEAIESTEVSQDEIDHVTSVFDRRIATRMPAAYLIGEAWLKGYPFRVDPRVIIPRSFIAELLIDHCQPWIADPLRVNHILDLCTGSGCLAIIAADQFPNAKVVASDISPSALEVARLNLEDYELTGQVTLMKSDVFDSIPTEWSKRFDLIISNPPYVPMEKRSSLPMEFEYEPEIALMADDHGMAIIRRILQSAPQYLSEDGMLIVEVGNERAACDALLEKEFPGLHALWIETDEQSDNVFLLTASQLQQHPWRPTP